MTYIKHPLVMLPTNEKTNLCFVVNTETSTLTLFEDAMEKHKRFFPQNLYLLSNDEPKQGEYGIDLRLDKTNNQLIKWDYYKSEEGFYYRAKKIIATTNKSLTLHNNSKNNKCFGTQLSGKCSHTLPQIPESFIEYFVSEYNKGREITSVLVEYEEYCEHGTFPVLYNKPKQIIERGAGGHICSGTNRLKINTKNNTINIKPIKDSWSREEYFAILIKYRKDYEQFKKDCHFGPNEKEIEEWVNKWIEQNL